MAERFTVYDKDDHTTWPPGAGYEVLVCYLDRHGKHQWTVTWSEYGANHDYAALVPKDIGTDWVESSVQRSDWVAWRLLNADTDAPNDDTAQALRHYYDEQVVQ